MYNTNNPLRDADRYDLECQKFLDSRPICHACREPIQEDVCYCFNGHQYCLACKDYAADDILHEFLGVTMA